MDRARSHRSLQSAPTTFWGIFSPGHLSGEIGLARAAGNRGARVRHDDRMTSPEPKMFPGARKAAAGCSGRDGATGRVAGNSALDAVECGMRRIIIASIVALLPTCVAAAELPKKTAAPPRAAKGLPCPA